MKLNVRCLIGAALSILFSFSLVNEKLNTKSEFDLAQNLINTKFSEASPDFDDLYLINTPDKVRVVTVYCNPSFCYKLRYQEVAS